jgi:hypothetical protein
VLQSLAKLVLLFTQLGHLSFEVLDVLPRALSDNALRFSVVCTFSLELSLREGIDTSCPDSRIGRRLRCWRIARELLLGLAPGTLSGRSLALGVGGAPHDDQSGSSGGKNGKATMDI